MVPCAARLLDNRPVCPGREHNARRHQADQAVVERDAPWAEPKAIGRSPRSRPRRTILERYPDGGATALRKALGERYGLNPDRLVCGAGSDELISIITHALRGPRGRGGLRRARLPHVQARDARVRRHTRSREGGKALTADVDAMLAGGDAKDQDRVPSRIPTTDGHLYPHEEVRRLHKGFARERDPGARRRLFRVVRRNDYEAGVELVASSDTS